MLYIRTDGNAQIGTGHIMRCLSIAHEERKAGGECVFILADGEMKPLLAEQGFSVICLDSAWNDLNLEAEKMERLISAKKIERLLVDSYFVTRDYLLRLHRLTHLIYMDDLNAFVYPCSELINYNIYAEKLDYPSRYPNTRLLLGPRYAPLREEFRNLHHCEVRERAGAVLVTTGGSDPYNVAGQLVERAKRHPNIAHLDFHIVVGRFNPHAAQLHVLTGIFPGVIVHQGVQDMSRLMLACDIAVSAGGSTLYELCACGIPTVVFSMADNQIAAVSAFNEGYMLGAGDFRDNSDICLDRLTEGIAKLASNNALRQDLSDQCKGLVTSTS